jgi:NAD(P)-dependent dehydrogenase (short-subunit alcohol dehydrogenase family)
MDLSGTNAVITGGCSGIGLETARMLASRGATVVVGCRPPAAVTDAASQPPVAGVGTADNDDEESFEPPSESGMSLDPDGGGFVNGIPSDQSAGGLTPGAYTRSHFSST